MIGTRVALAALVCTAAAVLPAQSLTVADRDFLVLTWQDSLGQIGPWTSRRRQEW